VLWTVPGNGIGEDARFFSQLALASGSDRYPRRLQDHFDAKPMNDGIDALSVERTCLPNARGFPGQKNIIHPQAPAMRSFGDIIGATRTCIYYTHLGVR
jgi:hypothetical protein